MEDNNRKIDFAKKSRKTDEWYTPKTAIYPILKYINKNKVIWCPFDTKESNFVGVLKEKGYKIIYSHIDSGEDFFKYIPNEKFDLILSNPPYSTRNEILLRAFELEKPFALLMNTNGLFDSRLRWNLFTKNDFTLFYIKGRVNYMKEYGKAEKSSPPFQSAYICSKMFADKIVFQDDEDMLFLN